jgi:transposase-like protein
MLAFPIDDLMDEQKCYEFLAEVLHPEGLSCPQGHRLPSNQAPHKRERKPIVTYKCRKCGRVFNIFSETVLSGISFSSCEIVLLVRGVVQGDPTTQIALELDRDYSNLLKWRHRIQEQGLANRLAIELEDEAVEVDEVYQNSGHKGPTQDDDASSPPRERANKRRGRGTMETDRPPIVGLVGRQSNQVRLEVCPDAQQTTVIPLVKETTQPDSTIYSDEAPPIARLMTPSASIRPLSTVTESGPEMTTRTSQRGAYQYHRRFVDPLA